MRQQIFVGFCHTQCTHQTVFDPLGYTVDAVELCVRHGEDLIAQETQEFSVRGECVRMGTAQITKHVWQDTRCDVLP